MENDLEIYLYIKFRLCSFVYSNLSLFSVFPHFCCCQRSCDHISSKEFYCEFGSRICPQIFDRYVFIQDIIIDERDFTLDFNRFLEKRHYFLLIFVMNVQFLLTQKILKNMVVLNFCFIKTPNTLFKSYLSILVKVYLNYFFSVLEKFS